MQQTRLLPVYARHVSNIFCFSPSASKGDNLKGKITESFCDPILSEFQPGVRRYAPRHEIHTEETDALEGELPMYIYTFHRQRNTK